MIHFISDLHLSAQTPEITRRFLAFLATQARSAAQLYILGDLFEAWLGDDCIDDPDDPFARSIVAALHDLSASGTSIFVLHGNRDFLLGEQFAARCNAKLIADPYVLSISGEQFVLAHGDALCLADHDYQALRQKIRSAAWCSAFLARPLCERKTLACALRQQSTDAKREKCTRGAGYMALDPLATDDFIRAHGYATFIHGHTHCPATHAHLIDGISVERWVLSDWRIDHGEYLAWDGQTLVRHDLP